MISFSVTASTERNGTGRSLNALWLSVGSLLSHRLQSVEKDRLRDVLSNVGCRLQRSRCTDSFRPRRTFLADTTTGHRSRSRYVTVNDLHDLRQHTGQVVPWIFTRDNGVRGADHQKDQAVQRTVNSGNDCTAPRDYDAQDAKAYEQGKETSACSTTCPANAVPTVTSPMLKVSAGRTCCERYLLLSVSVVDDADVQVLYDHQDGGPGVLVAGADVVEAAVDALSLPPFSGHLT